MSDEKEKKIEVVNGVGNLNISPVYDDFSGSKPKKMQNEKPKNIVIPKVKKEKKNKSES